MAAKSILIDNMVVSWGVRGEANPEQQHLVGWTQRFIRQCETDGIRVFIPAPVVGESLLRVPLEEHEQVVATYARYFRILPFDLSAAREFARIWTQREPHLRAEDLRGGVEPKKGIYRFDCQIVAIALSRKLDCIYSHDGDVRRFAGGEIDVREIPEPPHEQAPLLWRSRPSKQTCLSAGARSAKEGGGWVMTGEWETTLLRDLLVTTKDGDWGKENPEDGYVPYHIIRGTDFPDVRVGDLSSVPQRYLPEHTVKRRTLEPDDILIETAGGTRDRPTGRSLLITEKVLSRFRGPVTCPSFARFLRIDRKQADPRFVFWYLQHLYDKGEMSQL